MTTAEERAEAAAIDVEGRQARIAEILGKSATGGQDAAIGDTRWRRSPVKGVCVNCGKHHSRHVKRFGGMACDSGIDSLMFSLERKAEPAAQVAGGLSQEQVEKIRMLAEAKIQALDANTKTEQAMIEACMAFDVYLDSLKAE